MDHEIISSIVLANEYMANGLLDQATMALMKSLERLCFYTQNNKGINDEAPTKLVLVYNSVMFNTHQEQNDSFLSPSMMISGDGTYKDIPFVTACICFNLGLCYQLCGKANSLITACVMYESAWGFLNMGCKSYEMEMTVCYNMSNCCYHSGQLDSVRIWDDRLKSILKEMDIWGPWALHYHMYILLEPNYISAGAA